MTHWKYIGAGALLLSAFAALTLYVSPNTQPDATALKLGAASSYTQDFDGLTNGDLNGQDSWSGSLLYDVQATVAFGGSGKAVSKAGTQATIQRDLSAAVDSGPMYVVMWRTSVGASGYQNSQFRNTSNTFGGYVAIVQNGAILVGHSAGTTNIGTATANTKYIFEIEVLSSTTFRVRVKAESGAFGSWTSTLTFSNSLSNFNRILWNSDDEGSGATAYFDEICTNDPEESCTLVTAAPEQFDSGVIIFE